MGTKHHDYPLRSELALAGLAFCVLPDPMSGMLPATVGYASGTYLRRHFLFLLWFALLTHDQACALLVSARGQLVNAAFGFAHAEGLVPVVCAPGVEL